ncbi:putative signal transducing protein [Flavihumibacter profundi]|uniref:putative signal transducing protein n=1 Tax=Flavihumibacter profundi TaxID=2716883 RepID=UPI001CC4967B|nr:DUF2007 domain-containing protein [Flavihumibacter profundi]MBZ5859057.1 DUF2007 domain-containing protein [Flavihumibacter profundi]
MQIRSYDNYIVANLQLNLLKDHGISCYLQDEHTITIDPLLSPAIGGMKLMVMENDADQASQLLENVDENYLATVDCPVCRSKSLEKITHVENPTGFWRKLRNRLNNGTPAALKTYYHCRSCGNKFSSLPA